MERRKGRAVRAGATLGLIMALVVVAGCSGTGTAVDPMGAGFNAGFWTFIVAMVAGIVFLAAKV